MNKVKVGVLGATGVVGQRFVQLLENHPFFDLTELCASERSAGMAYGDAVKGRWKVSADIPDYAKNIMVKDCKPGMDCRLVFSALDSSVAGPIEEEFASRGYIVSSNSKNHRMSDNVPLLIPEINSDHLSVALAQNKGGFIVTNPNCATVGFSLALAPIHKKFGIKKIFVTTMQALSGAGYPGVASSDILDNVIPYINDEEEKVESEILKILGGVKDNRFEYAAIKVSAHCNRVHTKDGHLETVNFELERKASLDEIKQCLREYNPLAGMDLPSAPNPPIIVREEIDRPQPRLDRDTGKGMAVVIGRLRACPLLDFKMAVLVHNTIRGAAGASILNAEYMYKKGLLN